MTLLATVTVWRKGIEELTHMTNAADPVPEIGWITFETKEGYGTIAGFAADGSPYSVSGKLSELTTKPRAQTPPTLQPLGSSGEAMLIPSAIPAPTPGAAQQPSGSGPTTNV